MTSAGEIAELVEIASAAALEGGGVLREAAMNGDDRARSKGRAGDLVTDADVRSERAIRALLAERRPDDAVQGEELPDTAGSGAVKWIVDPLDGTTNFTRRLPYYAVSVAAQEIATGRWLAGAVAAPVLDRLYRAGAGRGAELVDHSGTHRLPLPRPESSARLIGTGLSYDAELRHRQVTELAELVAGYTDLRRFGAAALDLCLVAEGALDAFVEADLAVHDWAAGALIAAESGAVVRLPSTRTDSVAAVRPR